MSGQGRLLAVDPGEKRIGLAVSDESGTIANPLQVLTHVSRAADAAAILRIANECKVIGIVIGLALGGEGEETPAARHAARLADALRERGPLPVFLWDESGSTQEARAARQELGLSRKRRAGHQDSLAAAVILQSYLDANPDSGAV